METPTPQLGRYVIQSELGRGAMGVVYKARVYQEAKAAAGLNHPNIVTVHDVGKTGDIVFMAMEYIEGVELRTLIGEGQRLGLAQAVGIAAQIAEGLAYAH